MVDGSGFGSRPGKPVNPRFSLNGDGGGQEVEDFSPKRPSVDRVSRPVPRRIGDQLDGSGEVSLPGFSSRKVFDDAVEDDSDIVLTRGVGDDVGVFAPVEPVAEDDSDDVMELSDGVDETVSRPATPALRFVDPVEEEPATPVSRPVRAVPPSFSDMNSAVTGSVSSSVEDDSDIVLTRGTGDDAPENVAEPVVGSVVPVVERVVSRPVDRVTEPVNPVVRPNPSVSKPGVPRVNPLFADPEPEKEDDINLDVGVDESSETPKRSVNSRFDFKVDRSNNVRGAGEKPVLKNGPDALMDSEDDSEFDRKPSKKSSKGSKGRKPSRPGFSIQERDITLLRFLTKYQFSYVDALARVLNSSPQSVTNRLRILEAHDLVKRQVIAAGSTLWQARKAGIELAGMSFTENKKSISFATIRHTVGLVNLAAELEREAPDGKDILGLVDKFGEPFPVMNRFPGGIRLYGEEVDSVDLTYGEMTVSEREIRQGQKRYRGGRSSAEMREMVELAVLSSEAPELEEGNEGLFVVYGSGGKTGEHVPDLIVTRPRGEDGRPNHFAIELELTAKSPYDWKRILRSYRDNGGMYSRIYYFTPDRPIANMIRNADEEVGLGDRLIIRKYTPKNKRQPFLG